MNPNRFIRIYMKLVGIAITHNLKQFLHDKKGELAGDVATMGNTSAKVSLALLNFIDCLSVHPFKLREKNLMNLG